MSVTKLCSSGTVNAMKSEEGNDSLDTFIRQAIGKEPFLPFSRTGDSPVQWVQLLHALDQPDLPGWPLLTPQKVQMQKCEKCSREFCSPINYRRHVRVHRRSLNVNKGSNENRDSLATFWDKLSLEEAKEVVSFDDVMLKGIPGSSILRALASSLRKPGVWTLPPDYVKAGSTLLDVIQAKPCRLPISSQDLFSILDDASERTFLCAGTADSIQRYLFDGETAKNSLELKHLVASTSFLFEQQLVKAWVAEKDAEALRCQKLLVEEEEAAQKRQAAILERKKQKKLRQKEQKAKEEFNGYTSDSNITVDEVERPDAAEISRPSPPSDSNSNSPDVPSNVDEVTEAQSGFSNEHIINQGDSHITNNIQMGPANGHRHSATTRWQVAKPQRGGRNRFHVSQNAQILKTEPMHKISPSKDRAPLNGKKVWTKKVKIDSDGKSVMPQEHISHRIEENKCEVIIGCISVTLESSVTHQQESMQAALKKNDTEKLIIDQVASRNILVVDKGNEGDTMLEKFHERTQSSESSIESELSNNDDRDNDRNVFLEDNAQQGKLSFNSEAAREFLARRWKEAISGDHVKLVLSPVPERPDEHYSTVTVDQEQSGVGDPENQFGRNGNIKFRKKPEKSMKIKYIPKQKAAA